MPPLDPSTLSDDDLRTLRTVWEGERAGLWSEVSGKKGAAHAEARAAYMAGKAEADAVVTELRRRGLIRRGRPAGMVTPTTGAEQSPAGDFSSTFAVEHSARRLSVTANGHVRFGDKDRIALASAIRAGVARLHFKEGEVLRGAFHGPKPTQRTDIENLVLYNLELPSATLQRGVVFEHTSTPPSCDAVGYIYEPIPAGAPTRLWRPGERLISWTNVALTGRTAPAVWWSMRPHGCPEGLAEAEEDLMIVCRIATPAAMGVTQIKALVDGALAAAHCMQEPNEERCALVEAALGSALAVKPDVHAISAALRDESTAVLGPCKDLVRWDGGINPDDHRLVAGVVLIEPNASTQTVVTAASVHLAIPQPPS